MEHEIAFTRAAERKGDLNVTRTEKREGDLNLTPRKAGRPQKDIGPKQVEKLAAMQCTVAEMAAFFGCSRDTLHSRFSDNIKKGRDVGKVSLRRLQWKTAERGNVTMQIWLGKQYLDQSDRAVSRDEFGIDPNSPQGIFMQIANQPLPQRPQKPPDFESDHYQPLGE